MNYTVSDLKFELSDRDITYTNTITYTWYISRRKSAQSQKYQQSFKLFLHAFSLNLSLV